MRNFYQYLTEMARPMSRNGVTYITRGGKWYKNDGTGEQEIEKSEYDDAKANKTAQKTTKTSTGKKIVAKKEYLAPKSSKLEKPLEYTSYYDDINYKEAIKKITQMNKLLSKCGCQPIQYTVTDVKAHITNIFPIWCSMQGITKENDNTMYDAKKVDVKIFYNEIVSQSGYTYLGTIDHSQDVIFSMFQDEATQKAIEKFRKRNFCDYCGVKRFRSKTCIFRNDETGELVQIGTKCLKDYIPVNIKDFITVTEFYRDPDQDTEDDESVENFLGHAKPSWDINEVIAKSISCIKKNGFKSSMGGGKSTKELVMKALSYVKGSEINPTREDIELVDVVKQWIEETEDNNTFINNVRQIISNGFCTRTTIGFIPAIVNSFFKEKEKQQEKVKKEEKVVPAEKEWAGNEGEKMEMDLTLKSSSDFSSAYGKGKRFVFNDDKGNIFVWFSNTDIGITNGKKIKMAFTIKQHNEFNKTKQNIITRVRIVKTQGQKASGGLIAVNKLFKKIDPNNYSVLEQVEYNGFNDLANGMKGLREVVSRFREFIQAVIDNNLSLIDFCKSTYWDFSDTERKNLWDRLDPSDYIDPSFYSFFGTGHFDQIERMYDVNKLHKLSEDYLSSLSSKIREKVNKELNRLLERKKVILANYNDYSKYDKEKSDQFLDTNFDDDGNPVIRWGNGLNKFSQSEIDELRSIQL